MIITYYHWSCKLLNYVKKEHILVKCSLVYKNIGSMLTLEILGKLITPIDTIYAINI